MMPGGETMALQSNSFGLGGGFGGFGNMMPGVMLPPRFMPSMSPMQQLHSDNIFTSELSLAPSCDIEERLLDGGQVEENEHLFVKPKEDELDSKSSSDNLEGGSGDDNEAGDPRPAKKKRYHRHTLHQIQEMERFFKECPHPDERQRQELSRELKLSPRQIKFWFQNKRTKLKVNAVVGYPASIAWWTKGNQPNMRDINSAQEFVEATKNAGDKLVLVYFYSVGCRSCKALHPKICQIAEDNPDIEVLKINFHENNALCRCLKVSMLPFLHFYRGKEGRIDAFSRSLTKIAKLRAAVAKHKGGSQSALPTPGPVVAVADQKDLKPLPTSSLATASSIL